MVSPSSTSSLKLGASPSVNAQSAQITTTTDIDTYGTLNQLTTQNRAYQIGISDDQGQRPTMEDAYGFVIDFDAVRGQGLFGVFDGHGNKSAAEWCGVEFHKRILECIHSHSTTAVSEVLTSAFESMDRELAELSESSTLMAASGCTAVTAFLRIEDAEGQQPFVAQVPMASLRSSRRAAVVPPSPYRRVLYCANVGDARAVLCRASQAVRLTYDHKATDPAEMARIKDVGGVVYRGRVLGYLNVTRSLGNHEHQDGFSLKKYVIGVPYTSATELVEEDECLILACDGLWDVISDQEAVDLIKGIEEARDASKKLLDYAIANGTRDNVTVIVVRLKPPKVPL